LDEISWRAGDFDGDDIDKASRLRKLFLDETADSLRRSCEPEYYRWKLFDNPLRQGVFYLAYSDGKVVGMTTITPKRLCIGGKLIDGGEIGDTFTHPEWQRKGIFTTLVNLSREEAIKRRLDLIAVETETLSKRTLLTETSDTWVNLHDDLHFLKRRDEFVWSSERGGYNHLYLYSTDGTILRALTAGQWNVDGLLDIDESTGLVYFASNRDTIIDKLIYTIHLNDPPGECRTCSGICSSIHA